MWNPAVHVRLPLRTEIGVGEGAGVSQWGETQTHPPLPPRSPWMAVRYSLAPTGVHIVLVALDIQNAGYQQIGPVLILCQSRPTPSAFSGPGGPFEPNVPR